MFFKLVALSVFVAIATATPSGHHYIAGPSHVAYHEPVIAHVGEHVQSVPSAVSHQSQTIYHSRKVVTPIFAEVVRTHLAPIVKTIVPAPIPVVEAPVKAPAPVAEIITKSAAKPEPVPVPVPEVKSSAKPVLFQPIPDVITESYVKPIPAPKKHVPSAFIYTAAPVPIWSPYGVAVHKTHGPVEPFPGFYYSHAPSVHYAHAPAVHYAHAPAVHYAHGPAVHYAHGPAVHYAHGPAVHYAPGPAPTPGPAEKPE